jgi:predicted Rossmann fold nucleotide-binding protein DprA/Smf involved in DNA uptake
LLRDSCNTHLLVVVIGRVIVVAAADVDVIYPEATKSVCAVIVAVALTATEGPVGYESVS